MGPQGPSFDFDFKAYNLSRIAIYPALRSCHTITEGPCAYMMLHFCRGSGIAGVYLDLTQLVRDLVRLHGYAGVDTYQEEV